MLHHLAILCPNYVDEIIAGNKTVECRLGREGHHPHGHVHAGDMVWLKDVGGPVRAVISVREVKTIRIAVKLQIDEIKHQWNDRILAPPEFWQNREHVNIATLIMLGDLCTFKPFRIHKKDRRAWVVLAQPPVPGKPLQNWKAP